MKILLASSQGYGCWFLLRLMREGHDVSWFIINEEDEKLLKNTLKGLIPPLLKEPPKFSDYDLVVFDSTGHPDLAEESLAETPTIGNSALATHLEDDRLFGIQAMELCGIEVPFYAVFQTPDEAKAFIAERPGRYVYKPFEPSEPTEHQESDVTYVSESAEDLVRCIDKLYVKALSQPFILQEVVNGIEVSTEGYFDGQNFHLLNYTLEEKKFMSGKHGPNTGCSGNLMVNAYGRKSLVYAGLQKTIPFLRANNFRGIIDLNTIVNEHHVYGLEWTSRFGFDCCATFFSMIRGDLGSFWHAIATGPLEQDQVPMVEWNFAASARYSIPPYPSDIKGKHPRGIPIRGVPLEDAWQDFYLFDVMEDGDGELVTAGTTGFIGCPISSGRTPQGAWEGVERLAKNLSVPNMQMRDDLKECTIERLHKLEELGWL